MSKRLERLCEEARSLYDPLSHFAHQQPDFYRAIAEAREQWECEKLPKSKKPQYEAMEQADGFP